MGWGQESPQAGRDLRASGLAIGEHVPGAKAHLALEPFMPGLKSRPISETCFQPPPRSSAASEVEIAGVAVLGLNWRWRDCV